VQNFNFNVEQQLGANAGLQIGYVGSSGRKLFRYVDINQTVAGGPRPFPSLEYINEFQSSSSSGYNALQLTLKVRNLHGLHSSVNYTWSHSIDNASDGQDYVPNASQPDNSFNPGAERANSNFDTRQRFTWNYSYDFPDPQRMKWLLGGWGVDGAITLATGQPFNVNYLFEADFNGNGEFFGRPDLVGEPFAGTRAPFNYLNLSAFKVPCNYDASSGECNAITPNQHFGSLGRNAFVGPSFRNFDFSLSKTQKLGERLKLQMRVDFFNVFNHPNFTNPLLPNFGIDFLQNGASVTGTGTGFLPITATPDVGSGNPFLGGGGPRNIQLVAKFTF
jgi:hypothetical protein